MLNDPAAAKRYQGMEFILKASPTNFFYNQTQQAGVNRSTAFDPELKTPNGIHLKGVNDDTIDC